MPVLALSVCPCWVMPSIVGSVISTGGEPETGAVWALAAGAEGPLALAAVTATRSVLFRLASTTV